MTTTVAITQRVVENDAYPERRDALAQDWLVWLTATYPAITCVPVPNRPADAGGWAEAVDPLALILTGGNDWGEAPERDATELELVGWFRSRNRPILGVCRGLQVINVVFGGSSVTHLEAVGGHQHVARDHPVTVTGEPFRTWAGSAQLTVNSFHNHGVVRERLGEGLRPFGMADDGIVEGLVHETEPIVGIQWHPERPNPARSFDRRLFLTLLSDGPFWRRQ